MFTIDLVKEKSSLTTNLRKENVFYKKDDEFHLKHSVKIVDMDISYNGHLHAILENTEENNKNYLWEVFSSSTLSMVPTDKQLTALKISNQISNQLLALTGTKDNNNHSIYFHYVNEVQRNQFNTGSFYEICNLPSPVDMLTFNHDDNFLSVVLRDKSICLYKLYFNEVGKKNATMQSTFDNLKSVSCDFVLHASEEFLVFGMNTINFWDINKNKWIVKQRSIYGWNQSEYMKSIVFNNLSMKFNGRLLIASNEGIVSELHTSRNWLDFSSINIEEERKQHKYVAYSSSVPYKGKEFDGWQARHKYFVTVTQGGYIRVWDFHFYPISNDKDVIFDSGVKNIKKILFHPVKNILFLIGVGYYKSIDIDYRRALQQYPRLSDINEVATNDKYIDHVSFQKFTFTKSVYTIYLFCDCVFNDIRGQRDMALTFNKDGFASIKIKDTIQAFTNMMEATDEEYFEDMNDLNYEDVKICLPELGTKLLKGVENLHLHSFYLQETVNMILNGSITFITYNDVSKRPAKRKKMELLNLRF